MTIERAIVAYQKLNEITQTFGGGSYHTLVQLHCMMNDLYSDYPVDMRELYETLSTSPASGFQCFNHHQHGMIVIYQKPMTPPPTSFNPLQGTSLFGSM